MSAPALSSPVHELTHLAVSLLDIPLEPASARTGEVFDRCIEHVVDDLLRAAAFIPSTSPTPAVWPVPLPDFGTSHRRRDQLLLRRLVLAGRYPASTATLRDAQIRCQQAVRELTLLRSTIPESLTPTLSRAASLLAGFARALDAYRRSAIRIQRALAPVSADRARQAELAARAERDLLRRLKRVGAATYGVQESARLANRP